MTMTSTNLVDDSSFDTRRNGEQGKRESKRVETAETPFEFFTVSYLTRIGNQSACTLNEFLTGLQECSDASIFHHTYQTLSSHHFLTEGFSNDFAQWAHAD